MPAAVLNQAQQALAALENSASASQAQVDLFAPPPEARRQRPVRWRPALAASTRTR
jgi:DNA mismatch repair protein MutS